MPVGAVLGQFAFHHILGGDTGVVRARHPEHVVTPQPPVTAQRILQGDIQGMAHVKNAGYIGRGNHDRIGGRRIFFLGRKRPVVFPVLVPFPFHFVRFVPFIQHI